MKLPIAPSGRPLPRRVRHGKHNGRTKGAFGGPPKKAAKEAFLRQSSEDAKTLANERSLKRLYADWRANMTPAERAAARKLKCLTPLAHDGAPQARGGREVDIDFHDPADLPEAADHRTAVDAIEPLSPFSVAIENLGSDEITTAADCFGSCLTWALDVPNQRDLVAIGTRTMVVVEALRPDLIGQDYGRPLNFLAMCAGLSARLTASPAEFESTGEIFGRVLEWVRRGTSVSEIGERLCLVAYVVRPTMMGSPTLHQLGEVMNKTRQAKDKLASCLRDTFAGIRAAAQRGEYTRDKCIEAH